MLRAPRCLPALALFAAAPAPASAQSVWPDSYIKASNPDTDDLFGSAVAASGTTIAVGAPREDSAATGIDGDQGDQTAPHAGAIYVLSLTPAGWAQEAYVKASNAGAYDSFGAAVAMDGDTLVVGASGERSASSGVDGDQGDDSLPSAGAVYVFVRSGGAWTQQAYIKASNPDSGDSFGVSVAIDGDVLVVGAPGEDSAATVVDGDQTDDTSPDTGAAYVFVRSGGTWTQQAYLKAFNGETEDSFGGAVAVSGETIVVAAPYEDSGGSPSTNGKEDAGAAYVFERSGGTWIPRGYLKASNPGEGDGFGKTLGIDGGTVVVGAHLEDGPGTGIDAPQQNGAWNSGAAYVFERVGDSWTQTAYVKSSNSESQDEFGWRVSVAGDRFVVGARLEDGGATDVDGPQETPVVSSGAGATYLFRRAGATWEQEAYLKASHSDWSDQFAWCALTDELVVVGAPYEDGSSSGTGGDDQNDSTTDAGAVWTFRFTEGPSGEPYCFGANCPCGNTDPLAGCANSTGQGALLAAEGTPITSRDDLVLTASQLPPNQSGILFMGGGQTSFPFGDGAACVAPGSAAICRFAVQNAGAAGTLSLGPDLVAFTQGLSLPCRIDPGETWHFQAWYRDPQGPCSGSFNYSNALSVSFLP